MAGLTADLFDYGLRHYAARAGTQFGCALKDEMLPSNLTDLQAITLKEGDIFVAENAFKRSRLEAAGLGVYDWSGADAMLDWAEAHGRKMRGHALVWPHSGNPAWLDTALATATAGQKQSLLLDWVEAATTHFAGRLESWDVANEVIWAPFNRADNFRNSPMLTAFGPGFWEDAFYICQDNDPGALRVWNQNGIASDFSAYYNTNTLTSNRQALLVTLEDMLGRGVPVQGVGIQAHFAPISYFGSYADFSAAVSKWAQFLSDLHNLGLEIIISEISCRMPAAYGSIEQRDRDQADIVKAFVGRALETVPIRSILTWGVTDKYYIASERPMPLDDGLRPKPMWYGLAQAFLGQ